MGDLIRIHGKPGAGFPCAEPIDDQGYGSCRNCGAARTASSLAGGICTVCGMQDG